MLLLVWIFLPCVFSQYFPDEPTGIDPDDRNAEEVYNKTYIEHETKLEKDLFGPYNSHVRPVQNLSRPTNVFLHWHVVHLSINQKEQTMTIHGHLYMTWRDEKLGWDPEEYNGIRMTRSKKWAIWHPKITVSNTASGVYSVFEISSQAHVLIQSLGKNIGAKIEMYPTFSIKAGCSFDYADFPDDYNTCTVSVYTPDTCDKVHLHVYGAHIPPTIMFGWGNQSDKSIISDFQILNINNSVVYYRDGNYSEYEPLTDEDAGTSWSMIRLTVTFRRHSALFGVNIVLPIFVVSSTLLSSFFLPNINHAIYAILSILLILVVFMEDLTRGVPLVVMGVPKCISLYGELMIICCLALAVHILYLMLEKTTNYGPPLFIAPYLHFARSYAIGIVTIERHQNMTWKASLPLIRPIVALAFTILFIGSYVVTKLFKIVQ